MPDKFRARERYGEAFWRKHHEAWQQSALHHEGIAKRKGFRSRLLAIGGRSSKPNRSCWQRNFVPTSRPKSYPRSRSVLTGKVAGIPLKAFGNWRATFKADPQLPGARTCSTRGRALSHTLSHGANHMMYRFSGKPEILHKMPHQQKDRVPEGGRRLDFR
jgi:hypothetical protein